MREIYFKRFVLAATGLVQGLVFLVAGAVAPLLQVTDAPELNVLVLSLIIFVMIAGLVFQFVWDGGFSKVDIIGPVAIGLLFSLGVYWQLREMEAAYELLSDNSRVLTLYIGTLAGVYILVAHFEASRSAGSIRYSYSELFHRTWNNILIVAIAYATMMLSWLVVGLWMGMFYIFGIEIFSQVFLSQEFLAVFLPVAFGFGLALGKESDHLIDITRKVLFSVFSFILPGLALVAIFWLVMVLYVVVASGGLGPAINQVDSIYVLPAFVAVSVVLINVVYQDFSEKLDFPQWANYAIRALIIILPVIAILNLFALLAAINRTGMVLHYFYLSVLSGFLLWYSVGYMVAFLVKPVNRGKLIKPVNIVASFLLVGVIVLVNSPLLDPYRVTAYVMYNGILNGTIKNENKGVYQYLANDLGRPGKEYFLKLSKVDKSHPRHTHINRQIELAIRGFSDIGLKKIDLKLDHFEVYGGAKTLPPDLFKHLRENTPKNRTEICKTGPKCMLLAIDLDNDGKLEYVYIGKSTFGFDAFTKHKGGWLKIGEYQFTGRYVSLKELREYLQKNEVKLVPSRQSNLRIGDIDYRFH